MIGMSRHRFYAAPDEFDGGTVNLSQEETHHLVDVLRAKTGDHVYVFDGCGREYRVRFSAEKRKQAVLDVVDELSDAVESSLSLTLGQALAKGEKFDLIVQKATELGVTRIVPLLTEFADVKLTAAQADKRLDRWRRISLEALKQCGRRRLVEISSLASLGEFLSPYGSPAESVLVFSEKGGAAVSDSFARPRDKSSVGVLVGPEGGWSDRELGLLREGGCSFVSFGPRILRTETAAIVAVAIIQHVAGDLSRMNT